MGQHAGAAAVGVEESDHVPLLHILRIQGLDDDQVAALDVRIHRIGQHDERRVAAEGGDLAGVHQALDDHGDVHQQDRHQQDAKNNADYACDADLIVFFLLVFLFFFILAHGVIHPFSAENRRLSQRLNSDPPSGLYNNYILVRRACCSMQLAIFCHFVDA